MTRIMVDLDQWDSERLRSQALACDNAGELGAGMLMRRLAHFLDQQSARPLTVLDLNAIPHGGVSALRIAAMGRFSVSIKAALHEIANQIEEQTKPPRIEEPAERGDVVMTGGKYQYPYTRYSFSEGGFGNWIDENGVKKRWDDLIDPVLVTS